MIVATNKSHEALVALLLDEDECDELEIGLRLNSDGGPEMLDVVILVQDLKIPVIPMIAGHC